MRLQYTAAARSRATTRPTTVPMGAPDEPVVVVVALGVGAPRGDGRGRSEGMVAHGFVREGRSASPASFARRTLHTSEAAIAPRKWAPLLGDSDMESRKIRCRAARNRRKIRVREEDIVNAGEMG